MKLTSLAVALAATLGCIAGAHGQAFPSRPVTIIVPFPAGGPDRYAGTHLGRAHENLARPARHRRERDRRGCEHRRRPRRAGRARRLHPEHRQLDEPCRRRRDVSGGARCDSRHAAGGARQRHAVDDRRQERLPPKDAKELVAWLKANPGKASAATVGAGSGGARLLALFPAEDRHQLPARAIPRRRARDAGLWWRGRSTCSAPRPRRR